MKAGDLVRVRLGEGRGPRPAIHGLLGIVLYATERPPGRGAVTCIVQLFDYNFTHTLNAESLETVSEAQRD